MADTNHARGQILHHHGSGADHAQLADGDTGADKDIRAEPRVFPNHDRLRDEGHVPAREIMRAGAEVTVLTEVGAPAQRDGIPACTRR